MQRIEIFQSLWAMELRSPDLAERSHDENFRQVAEAGFDGVCIDPTVDEIDEFLPLRSLFERNNLKCMVNAFPGKQADLVPLLGLAQTLDACLVNVIGGLTPIRAADAVPIVTGWMNDAADAGLPILFETHRDSLLNDLYYTLQLMELLPDMRLCADLSHFVLDREMRLPIPTADAEHIECVLRRSDCFQGRVASREQIQIQLDFPQHQKWVEVFRTWWKSGIRAWRERSPDDATLQFLCELGPPPYAMTDRHQRELSDRWREALDIRSWVLDIWDELQQEDDAIDRSSDVAVTTY